MKHPKYWKSIEELNPTPEFLEAASKEFPTDVPIEQSLEEMDDKAMDFSANRRDFMKVLGFGITAATLSACMEGPVKKAIPYVIKPDDITPGVANWYASTSSTGLPVTVKTREGRPIKLEGNPDSGFTRGGLDAITQASLLNLYDLDRAQKPKKGDAFAEWGDLDAEIIQKLNTIQANGGKVRVLSSSVYSPSTKALIGEFLGQFADGQHVSYDAVSASAISKSHELDFGARALPSYRIDQAKVLVSFSADFLGTWISPVEFSAQYASRRDPDGAWMSRHFQVESILSTTGANADHRVPVKPSDEGRAILSLYNKVARKLGQPTFPADSFELAGNMLEKIATELVAAQGQSLVLCGTNDLASQHLINGINAMLGNYGTTVDMANPSHMRQGDDEALSTLVNELKSGEVSALFVLDANPVYDTPYGADIAAALGSMDVSVSFSEKADETAIACGYHCPANHFLESWGDAQQNGNSYSLMQPTIHPIFSTRQAQDSFLKWMGSGQNYRQYLMNYWQQNLIGNTSQSAWDETLRKGVLEMPAASMEIAFSTDQLSAAADKVKARRGGGEDTMELVVYESVAIRDGKFANNPWLQELPDPITRCTWDNYVTVPFSWAQEKGYKNESVITLTVPGQAEPLTLPLIVQTGQAVGTIGVALGYGRKNAGRVAAKVGEGGVGNVDVYPLVGEEDGQRSYSVSGVTIGRTGRTYPLALTQTFNYLYDTKIGQKLGGLLGKDADRTEAIIKETALEYYKSPADADNPYRASLKEYNEKKSHLISLWSSHFEDQDTGRFIHWAMAIDLNKCTGCGACVVSCNAENNVPVVGKEEVRNRRNMHWMRIDRYYSGDPDAPDTVFQPMLCQHCDNAPCETVCPVLATIHSKEGLNQMTYNRCVGTRYCANNCPYKVRKFNWFNYQNGRQFTDINPSQNKLGQLVLNPDVTVRFRGVMEKCSFCVQRLQEAKLKAKINGKSTFAKPDPNFKGYTACQQSCPTGAIVFGDRNDPESEISKLWSDENERKYLALEEVKTLSSVAYMTKVRNRTAEEYEQINQVKEEVMDLGGSDHS